MTLKLLKQLLIDDFIIIIHYYSWWNIPNLMNSQTWKGETIRKQFIDSMMMIVETTISGNGNSSERQF